MSIYSIYKITNKINQKLYIGFTGKSIDRRLYEHCWDAQNLNRYYKLHHAIRKYGAENFEIEVIYQSTDHDHTKSVMEPFFIAEYETYANDEKGYNMTEGGEGWVSSHTEETKAKISRAKKGQGRGVKSWNSGIKAPYWHKDACTAGRAAWKERDPEGYEKHWKHAQAKSARHPNRLKSISRRVSIDGMEYSSAREAQRCINTIKYPTLIKRIESVNFPDYYWLD